MRVTGFRSVPAAALAFAVLAFALLAAFTPAAGRAGEPQPPACAPDAAQCPPPADKPADAASDQDSAPPAEPRIDAPFGHAWLGAADADVTLVVFADYSCAACRAAQPVLDQLLASDGKLKVVYRFLVNEEEGRAAARTSLAVAKQDADWGKFHRALDAAGDTSSKSIVKALAAGGIDQTKLPTLKDGDPDTESLDDELLRNDALINQRKGTAIPSWLIGDGAAQRGFDLPTLQAAVAKARADKAH